jgi:hypothetical protein
MRPEGIGQEVKMLTMPDRREVSSCDSLALFSSLTAQLLLPQVGVRIAFTYF